MIQEEPGVTEGREPGDLGDASSGQAGGDVVRLEVRCQPPSAPACEDDIRSLSEALEKQLKTQAIRFSVSMSPEINSRWELRVNSQSR